MVKSSVILALSVAAALVGCAPRGEALLARAEASLAEGQYRAAMIDLRNYVARHPEDAKSRAMLARAMLETGDLSGAEVELGKARELGAERVSLVVTECRVLVTRTAFERVLAECGDIGDPSTDGSLAVTRGEAQLGLQQYEAARASFETAAERMPDSLDVVRGLASAALGLEGIGGARAVFDGAPATVKEQPRYWTALGYVEMRGGDPGAAERAFDKAASMTEREADSPDHLGALAGLTEAQLRQGKSAEASASSDRLLAAAPKSPYARLLRAQAAAGAGDLGTARTLLEEVVSKDPDNAQARTMLGLVNLQQGNLGQAEMHLANVVSRDPDNLRAQQLLATVRNQVQSPDQTLAALKPALDRPTADPALFALASQLSLQSGDRERALGYLDQAAAAGSQATPQAQIELANGYLAAGEIDRAMEILEAMPASEDATGAQRETLLVAALMRQGKLAEAMARADELAARPPSDVAAHGVAGAAYAALGQRDKARGEWARVLEANPTDVRTRINLARLDVGEGKPDAAQQQLEKVLETDPTNLLATLGLVSVAHAKQDAVAADRWMRKAVSDHPESADVRLAQVQYALGKRDFAEARSAADEALRLAPKNGAAANARGLAELGAGDLAAAIVNFRQAVEWSPRGGFQGNLARAYVLDGKPDEAFRVLDEDLGRAPQQPATLGLAATIALQAGRVDKAAGYVDRLARIAPEAPGTLRLQGDVAFGSKRYGDALRHYEAAAASGSDAALAIARYRAGSAAGVAQPQKPLEDWLARRPDDAAVRVALAEHQQIAGQSAAAITNYEKVLELTPGNVVAANNLAVLYQEKGDARALPMAKRAYDAASANAAIQDTYGWALVQSGDVERGVGLLREAAQKLPGVPEVQFHLGTALARKGEVEEARRLLGQVVASDAPARIRGEAERELSRLGR